MGDVVMDAEPVAEPDLVAEAVEILASAGWSDIEVTDFHAWLRVKGTSPHGVVSAGHTQFQDDPRDPRPLAKRLIENTPRPSAAAGMDFVSPPPVAAVIVEQPPARDLDAEKERLRQAVLAEAARRTRQSVELYQTVTQLAAIPEIERTVDQQLQLLQHASWAVERETVEAVRVAKVAEIDALPSLQAVDAYDVTAGWPA